MKRTILIAIACWSALALNTAVATAQPEKMIYGPQESITILTPAGLSVYASEPVVVYMNGRQMTLPSQSSFIANIHPGRYMVQVFEAEELIPGRPEYRLRPVWEEEVWCKPERVYRMNFTRRGLEMRPDLGYFPYPSGQVDSELPGGTCIPGNGFPGHGHHDLPGSGYYPDCFPDYNQPDYSYPGHYGVMPPKVFDRFLKELSETRWDDEREEMITIAKKNCMFTVEQCHRMMKICRFESDKLAIAKLVYPAIVDKQNVFLLFDCFRFRSDKTEFADFIRDFNQ